MRMKPVTFLLAVGLILLARPFVANVMARPAYNAIMTHQYQLREDKELRSTCLYCHTTEEGGDDWNAFGLNMREVFFDQGNRRVPETLYETLKLNLDSDKDGYRDILEVIGKSFPGDPKSTPTASVADLEKQLQEMGGLEAFKPQNPR